MGPLSTAIVPFGRNVSSMLSAVQPIRDLYRHRYLIGQLVRRDVLLKYRGSYLGIGWSFLHPLLLLAAFTVTFGGVMGARWTNVNNGPDLAVFIYCGLLVFSPFAEVLAGTPRLLPTYQSYVKKIIFPTEILPLTTVLSATVHGLTNAALLSLAAVATGHAHGAILLLPLALLPVWLFTLGIAWVLATIGAYLRDLPHIVPVLTQILLFLSPVFYPLEAAPAALRKLQSLNPLAFAIEDVRGIVLQGTLPQWDAWLIMLAIGLTAACGGLALFHAAKEDFADVL